MKNKRIISTITAAACAVCIALSSGNMFSVEAEGIAGNTANVKASGTTSICIYNDASIKLNTVNGNSCNFEITSTYLNSEGNPTPVNITVNGAVVKNNGIVNVSGAKGTPIDLTVGDNSKIEVKAPASKLKTVSNDDLSLQSTETIFLTSDEVSQLCNSLYIEKYLSNGAKGFIINQYWFDKHKDDKALLASEYKRLLKNWAGKQAAYIVSIPLDSVCTASERYKGFMKNLDDLEKEANEAKQAGSGNSTNTATSGGGGETNVPVTGITISPIRLDIPVGSTGSFTATVSPDNATNKTVNWSSDNPEAASVDSNGTVTGKESTGDQPVTITATAADGGSTATGKVIVSPNP